MKNILVVDDEETVLVTMVEWFASTFPDEDYNVLVANNGIEAVKTLSAHKINLMITDLNMPKMDGFELLAHMNNEYPPVPIIVISAFATPDIKNKAKNLGALHFIPKPFTSSDLEEIDFKKILGDYSRTDTGTGHVNGISLQSFLQLINLESKTCTLTIKSQGKTGIIYVDRGDLMNAKTGKLEGGEAAKEIISWNNEDLNIDIDNNCPETEKKIKYTIMSLLMESARMADEKSAQAAGIKDDDEEVARQVKETVAAAETAGPPPPLPSEPAGNESSKPPEISSKTMPAAKKASVNLHKLNLVRVQSRLKDFAALDGFAGAVLSTTAGDILQIVSTESSDINLEQAAIYANSILGTSKNSTTKMRIEGDIEMVQVDTKAGHMLITGQQGFNIMLILATTSSLGLGKIMASKTLAEIMEDLNS
ncbi:MAG: response regulator [Desulfurivibrionaceae bacterium]|nr:response regulator [Desulfobulbales bacterium]MDT8334456.1 response regulator [Desulfurivibrionaceae bacterium]